jgi:hypothetical protein
MAALNVCAKGTKKKVEPERRSGTFSPAFSASPRFVVFHEARKRNFSGARAAQLLFLLINFLLKQRPLPMFIHILIPFLHTRSLIYAADTVLRRAERYDR